MKNILIAAVFLFGQLEMTFARSVKNNSAPIQTSEKYKSANFQIENLKFSDLILTKEELNLLTSEEQMQYQMAIISLSMILESKQQNIMEYDWNTAGQSSAIVHSNGIEFALINLKSQLKSKINFLSFISISNAWAIIPVILGAAAWTGARMLVVNVGSRIIASRATSAALVATEKSAEAMIKANSAVAAKSAATLARNEAGAAVRSSRMAVSVNPGEQALKDLAVKKAADLKTAASSLAKATTEAKEAAKDAVKVGLERVRAAEKALKTADPKKLSAKEMKQLESQVTSAKTSLEQAKGLFGKAFGKESKVELQKLMKVGWAARTSAAVSKYGPGVVVDGLAFYAAGSYLKSTTGKSIEDYIAEWIGWGDLEGPALPSLSDLKSGDSSKSQGKSCLFGGHASQWTIQADSVLRCPRPASANSEECSGGNKFLCASHGIQLQSGSIDKDLCLDPVGDLNDLTIRCSKLLIDTLDKKASAIDEAKRQEFFNAIKKHLVGLERNPGMQEADGKAKSILAYCAADNVEQKPECGAIMEIVGYLNTGKVPQILATRPPAPPAAASAASDGDAPPPPPAAGSSSGGSTDGPTRPKQ